MQKVSWQDWKSYMNEVLFQPAHDPCMLPCPSLDIIPGYQSRLSDCRQRLLHAGIPQA